MRKHGRQPFGWIPFTIMRARILFATILSLALFAAWGASPAQAAAKCVCTLNGEVKSEPGGSCASDADCSGKCGFFVGTCKQDPPASDSSASGPASTLTLKNPLGVDDPLKFVGRLIKGLLGIIGGVALALFIYGGFLWMTSGGSSEKIQKGRDTLLWTSIGLAVIFASYALVDFIIGGLTGK